MTAPTCDQCLGPLYACDIASGLTTCVECARRALSRMRGKTAPTDEWAIFCAALQQAAASSNDGRVHQHLVRPLIRGRVFHKNVGLFYRRAKSEGLLEPVGEEQSKDVAGRNTHHKSPVYELRAA